MKGNSIPQPTPDPVSVDYQRLFNALPESYIAFKPNDPDFTILAENNAHGHVAMVDASKSIGQPLLTVFPDTSEKYLNTGESDLLNSLRKVIATGKPDSMDTLQYDLANPNGTLETRFWKVTHYPVFDAAGKLIMIYQATQDITSETVVTGKLRQAQRQLDDALAFSMIGTWLWDIKADKVNGDANMAAMFGVSTAQASQGVPIAEFTRAIHPEDRPRVQAEIAKVIDMGGAYHSEYRTVIGDGTVHWLIARGRLERDADGNPASFPGVLVDITERKLIENNLQFLARASSVLAASLDYKRTLKTIAKLVVPAIADWCTIDILNDNGELEPVALAHKDPAQVKWAQELRRAQGAPALEDQNGAAQVIRTGESVFYPEITDELIQASAKSKTELEMLQKLSLTSVIMVPLRIHDRNVGAITLISTEQKRQFSQSDLEMAEELASRTSLAMTNASLYQDTRKELAERMRLEEALRQANAELENRVEERTAALEETNVSLQRSNQELQDFAYVASHDLQEPLRKIQAFGNLLESEFASELGEGKDYLTRMRGAAARMSALIEDILSFSRVTTKGRPFTDVNLKQVVREVMSDLEIRISETKAVIEIGDLPSIHADAMQMRQLLQNLIANAIKFHRPDVAPRITISASITNLPQQPAGKRSSIKYCRIAIADNGLGFDEKYLDRIFDVFQRLHSREHYEGTGIGLAVCRKIVERHGGTITATSKEGAGATFIIDIPMRHKKGDTLL